MIFLHLLLYFVTNTTNSLNLPAGIQSGIWRGVLTTNGGELPFNFETSYLNGYLAVGFV